MNKISPSINVQLLKRAVAQTQLLGTNKYVDKKQSYLSIEKVYACPKEVIAELHALLQTTNAAQHNQTFNCTVHKGLDNSSILVIQQSMITEGMSEKCLNRLIKQITRKSLLDLARGI